MVDLTDPVRGWVKDGLDPAEDIDYSYVDSAVYCNWNDFYDPESDIVRYEVQSFVSGTPFPVRSVGLDTQSVDISVSLKHGDTIRSILTAVDGAERRTSIATNGYIIDKSPPLLVSIGFEGSRKGIPYFQADVGMITARWVYKDPESGIKSYQVAIYELHHGSNQAIYPSQGDWADFPKQGDEGAVNQLVVSNLALTSGAEYVVKVKATNNAKLAVSHTSEPMTVDDTPPVIAWVVVGNLDGSDENTDSLDRVVQSDKHGIKASWYGSDPESGIDSYLIAVGTTAGGSEASGGWRDVGFRTSAFVDRLLLSVTDETSQEPVYFVTVKAHNAAGLESKSLTSKPIVVVEADVAGVVLDGPDTTDAMFQRQSDTVTVQFTPFSSKRCGGISKYEWAIGTSPLEDDLQSFSKVGIVVRDDDSGFAQVPFQLENGKTVYSTVKATTKCGDNLMSSSSGVIPDNSPPQIKFTQLATADASNISSNSLYVYSSSSIGAVWKGDDQESGIVRYAWSSSIIPMDFRSGKINYTTGLQTSDSDLVRQSEGVPNFVWVEAENRVSYRHSITSVGLVVDSSPPSLGKLHCPDSISHSASDLQCCWSGIHDSESGIVNFRMTLSFAKDLVVAVSPLLPTDVSCFSLSLEKFLNTYGSHLVTLEAVNGIQHSSFAYATVIVDVSAPTTGNIQHLSDEYHYVVGRSNSDQVAVQCQSSETEMHIAWDEFTDTETSITRFVLYNSFCSASCFKFFHLDMKLLSEIIRVRLH